MIFHGQTGRERKTKGTLGFISVVVTVQLSHAIQSSALSPVDHGETS